MINYAPTKADIEAFCSQTNPNRVTACVRDLLRKQQRGAQIVISDKQVTSRTIAAVKRKLGR